MDTTEVLGWLVFLVVITLLFFAAFGGSNIRESDIEEYMENLLVNKDWRDGQGK
tara:strand:+ start:22684 stop:22845 length:162 start_codon:yes stop_codon:yes gene_type:complete